MLPVAEGHHPFSFQSHQPKEASALPSFEADERHLGDIRLCGIEKIADAIALAGVPVLHGRQYVVGCVAIGAREQFGRIHKDDLVQGASGANARCRHTKTYGL